MSHDFDAIAARVEHEQIMLGQAGIPADRQLPAALRAALRGVPTPAEIQDVQVISKVNADRADAAEKELRLLRGDLDVTRLERINAIYRLLRQVPARSRTARHDDTCWQRHPACLADRITTVLDGPLPAAPGEVTGDA